MNKKKRKKIKKNNFISDINIVSKSIIIFVLVLVPIVFIILQCFFLISSYEKNKKSEMEKVEVDATEQYLDIIIENMVSIAKTIYSNEKIYEFLNTTYASNMDYFDAYYQFTESKTLVIAETSIVKDFKIYTANSTIIKGGNINNIDQNVKNEKWYTEFHNMNKDLVVYCDQESVTLSIIRKLDFVGVKTGEALLKMDINIGNIQKSFEKMNFDGEIYVTSGNVLLYSNMKKAKFSNIYNFPSSKITKSSANFYTATVDFYASANEKSVLDLLVSNPANIVFIIVFIISCLLVLHIIIDLRKRMIRLSETCKEDTANIRADDFGDDEIGVLHRNILSILNQMNIYKVQSERLNDYIGRYTSKSRLIETQAFDLDAGVCYMERFGKDACKNVVNTNDLIILEREAINLRRYIEYINSKEDPKINYKITTDTSFTNDTYILPLSLVLISIDIIENALKEKQKCDFEMSIKQEEEKIFVYFKASDVKFTTSKLLRIRAAFEIENGEEIPEFELGYYCNPYIRIKKFYDQNVDINIISESEIEFELIFNKAVMYRNYRDEMGGIS